MPSIKDVGLGKVGNNSHPLHPTTIHLPIAFLLASSALDLATYATTHSTIIASILSSIINIFSSSTSSSAPLTTTGVLYHLSLFAYVSTIAGVVTALPALSTGLVEGYALINANGLDLSNSKVRKLVVHAGLNDVALVAAIYQIVSKSKNEVFMPSGVNLLISALMLAGVGYSSYLGGGLVYEYGVGVQRQGDGKVEKERGKVVRERRESEKRERRRDSKEL